MEAIFDKAKELVEGNISLGEQEQHSHTDANFNCDNVHAEHLNNRFNSFVPPSTGNAKWFVDGCGYFWALSVALENATEYIWILDWWLSPELYLRRPPSANEQYRLDRMLRNAAERGVLVNIIVYKEVPQALSLDSEHTKEALEKLHPNIKVFRHPDHIATGQALESEIASDIKTQKFGPGALAELPNEMKKLLYGLTDDVVLYWAHHEKLCIVDGKMAFMGGLDACFGRWDTNNHPIADTHPGDLNCILFPGQDYNNARVYDFQNVEHYEKNKLDRTQYSRMGWSDLSICMKGPIVQDLVTHFVQRWNFIFYSKYDTVSDENKYAPLYINGEGAPPDSSAAPESEEQSESTGGFFSDIGSRITRGLRHMNLSPGESAPEQSGAIQLCRSCSKWSHGVPTEHSIANAYIQVIQESQYFVYIENQFFITATSDKQDPIKNKIGAAIVERIIRAANNGEDYKMIVCIPAVPAFAGDLQSKDALETRAIMMYQYNSICRGGNSIMETIAAAGIDPKKYIRFYNLRNYDRINSGGARDRVEEESGINYEDARKEHDDIVGAGWSGGGEGTGAGADQENAYYNQYQDAARKLGDEERGTQDTVSECYMLDGPPVASIPWDSGKVDEIDAFVSEELYIHTKCLIADDKVVILGSANLNDRSQLGYHDSEIAVVIEDPEMVPSTINGQEVEVSKFATSLRRQLFRKHLGLLPFQDPTQPTDNFQPIDIAPVNDYDWDSPADLSVRDPLSPEFDELWNGTARTNTEVFEKAFHPVPSDRVRNWDEYKEWFEELFVQPGEEDEEKKQRKYNYGHVVREEFEGGVEELKEWLGRVRGMLVEMPLEFLVEVEDLAKEGLELNAFTEEVFT